MACIRLMAPSCTGVETLTEGVVLSGELAGERSKSLLEHTLDAKAVLLVRAGGEGEGRDIARGADAGGNDVLVKLLLLLLGELQRLPVEVRLVVLRRRVETVPSLDDRVDDILERLKALLVTLCVEEVLKTRVDEMRSTAMWKRDRVHARTLNSRSKTLALMRGDQQPCARKIEYTLVLKRDQAISC
jgi:hypothetical protein